MMLLLALHKIAAERGDGLRPELLRLLERSHADLEANRTSTVSEDCENSRVTEIKASHASTDPEAQRENVLPLHDRSRKRA
jgi:hypothetical protein